ncbi:hypothetical protein V5O48_014044 [Marasmius crinis-equi]|uniref:BTB domain-containing protein n=1 Tax=Marasmius crinis-equi TaxID=585013 RepID=A0ABR3EYE7_9AGAR
MVAHALKPDMKLPDSVEKHLKYQFEDANVSFIVEDRIRFDVHRFLLQRDSEFFKRVLSSRPNSPDGTYSVPGLDIHQFESLLDFFYEGMYCISPISTPIESWINLLSVSTIFAFPRARQHAIDAIDLCQSSDGSNTVGPARMIHLVNLYGVEKWLGPAYLALAERDEIVSADEAGMIGMTGLLVIMTARETRFKETIRRISLDKCSGESEDPQILGSDWSVDDTGVTGEATEETTLVETSIRSALQTISLTSSTSPPQDVSSALESRNHTVGSATLLAISPSASLIRSPPVADWHPCSVEGKAREALVSEEDDAGVPSKSDEGPGALSDCQSESSEWQGDEKVDAGAEGDTALGANTAGDSQGGESQQVMDSEGRNCDNQLLHCIKLCKEFVIEMKGPSFSKLKFKSPPRNRRKRIERLRAIEDQLRSSMDNLTLEVIDFYLEGKTKDLVEELRSTRLELLPLIETGKKKLRMCD